MAEEHRSPSSGQPQRHTRVTRRRRSRRSKVAGAFLYVLFVIGLSAVLATVGWVWANDLLALNKEYTSVIITVPDDAITYTEQTDENGNAYTVTHADMGQIVDQLEEEGLIEYKFLFQLYSWFSNADEKIVAGTYELNTEMDYRALVTNMSSSSSTRQTIDLTIPEGYTVDQIFALLDEEGVSTAAQLEETAANHDYAFDFLEGIPLGDYHRLEGYLFPDTYTFYLGENPLYVINKMLVNFYTRMEDYFDQFTQESAYSLHDIVVIASMIEKETDGEDYRDISSVIYNRLENTAAETAGYLQIDATLVYINGGNVPTDADREIDSPYNTYLYQGLPAGPISNPGMESLYAAMNPNDTSYYYYVLNPETGRHDFSRTYAEHQAKVAQYANSAES
ncbi:MAG TPA: endolytic transglycosylase MltG [Candidatus Enterenecus stercoripullorum]|nr:endolytic transglycosylase MltG [Candidatus Enterenecus stercoripullorum]